jgi:hypothetical protein
MANRRKKRERMNAPHKFGSWTLGQLIGKGGNGRVFKVRSDAGVSGVIKRMIRPPSAKSLQRFGDEVNAMRKCAGIPGVIPLLDANVPANVGDGEPWIVMAQAENLHTALTPTPPLRAVVAVVRDIATTLRAIHARGVSHRDIKPDNLFRCDGRWAVGDFGLADFEGKAAETAKGERIGPMLYIAHEMLNDPIKSDGAKADVFSLAKVLWVLATGQKYPLPGAYERDTDAFRIGSYLVEERTDALDRLIVASTVIDPMKRPTMAQIVEELDAWLVPRPAAPMAINVNFGPNVARLDVQKAGNEAAQRREVAGYEARIAASRRMRERFRQLANDIGDALRPAPFDQLDVAIDNLDWGFRVLAIARESGNQITELDVQLTADAVAMPIMTLTAQIEVRRSGAEVIAFRTWEQKSTFLEGGSEEPVKTAAIEAEMRAQLQPAIDKVMEMAFRV